MFKKSFIEVDKYIDFSSDSKHVLYAGFDGTITLRFNTDYGASNVRNWNFVLVLDTTIVAKYNYIGYIKFKPNSIQYLFTAEHEDNNNFLVIDKKENRAYKFIHDPIYNYDGKEYAYRAIKKNGKECVVLDGIEYREYEETDNIIFSPDSKLLAYVAKDGEGKYFIVQNIMEGQTYDWVSAPVFSLNSKSIAYVAKKDNKYAVVINGKENKYYDKVLDAGNHRVNFNSQNRVYYVAMEQNKLYYVEKSVQYDN